MSDDPTELLRRQLDRERRARLEAEAIAERVTAELYETVKKLEQTNEVLDNANRSMRDFVAVASHDLRQPLNGIMGMASVLRAGWGDEPPERQLEYVTTIEEQGRHLNTIVQDLLTVSQLEAGAMETHMEEVSLARLLEKIAVEFVEASSDISVSCPEDLKLVTDPHHLRRIMVNYLTNAFKYGGPPIDVKAFRAGEWVRLQVCDHGSGVPPDFVPRLFNRFARADETARSHDGTGLGLSIVRGLAVANGGDAWYEPTEPHGSCFSISLPVRAHGERYGA